MASSKFESPALRSGFSLIELLVVMAMLSIFGVVFYGVLTFNVDVTRAQSQISDMQQNLRVAEYDIARFSRMAGRGGLPVAFAGGALPAGVAVAVDNNVAEGTRIGGAGSPEVLVGTDVLTVRGVFASPVYQLKAPPGALASGILQINALSPKGVVQELAALAAAVERTASRPGSAREALVLVSPLGQYSVFALAGGTVQYGQGSNPPVLGVEIEFVDEPAYRALLVEGGINPPSMTTVASVGLIEEYRYYVRSVEPVPERVVPRLSRARFFPGTDTVHPSDPTAAEDIADHIVDLQVALGVDRFGPGGSGEADGVIYEGARGDDAANDEWLFNDAGDDAAIAGVGNLELVRMSLLARTSRGDRKWAEVPLLWLEDHDYDGPRVSPAATDPLHRRRLAQTVVNLRNG